MTWTNRPSAAPGEYLDGAEEEAVLDRIEFLSAPPRAVLRQTTLQSLTTSVFGAITYTTEDEDNYGGHSTTTNTSRYTAQVAGWYQCSGKVAFAANATGRRGGCWFQNGAAVNGGQIVLPAGVASTIQVPVPTMLIYLALGDYLEIHGFQDSGGALNTDVGSGALQSIMSLTWHSET